MSIVLLLPFLVTFPASSGDKIDCGADVYGTVRTLAHPDAAPIEIKCDLTLVPGETITQPLAFSGHAASGRTLDCQGATLDGTVPAARTVVIRSLPRSDGSWDVPADVTIKNCFIKGDVRIQGLGPNGEAEPVRQSSLEDDHVARAQTMAPSRVLIDNITLEAIGPIPLYLAPGVTDVTVKNSKFTGRTTSTVIYLDAESARTTIQNNFFAAVTTWREVVAIDSSAENIIENNTFSDPLRGGIFIYQNCGEGGTIRRQDPQRNVIRENVFLYSFLLSARPAVWLGSRQGFSIFNMYCLTRPGITFDSFRHNDKADNNTVTGNRLGGAPKPIVDNGRDNLIINNH